MTEPLSPSALVEPERGLVQSHPGPPGLVGIDPLSPVVMMEDHDGAYYAWKRAGISGRILLHIDAHIDWNWIADKNPLDILQAQSLQQLESMLEERSLWNLSGHRGEELVHIGNYIYPALQEGIVKEFFWVLPDTLTENRRQLRGHVQMFEDMRKVNPHGLRNVRLEGRRVVAEIYGRTVTACSLSDLPTIQEPVLLDIDTDFLMRDPAEACHTG